MRSRFIAVAAGVVLLVGCGAVEEPPNVAEAVANTEAAASSRVEVRGLERERLPNPVRYDCSGEADYARKRLEWTCRYGKGDYTTVRAVDGKLYITGGGAGGKWQVYRDDEEVTVSDATPQRLLSMLRSASRETKRLGEEDVRGVPTDHYRLIVDCEEADLDHCDRTDTAPVEVWIGADGLVRRVSIEDGRDYGTIEFFDFGVPVAIEAPPSDQVEDPAVAEEPRPCNPEGGTPIRASRAIDALRRAGFSVQSDRDACFGDAVAALDNTALPRVLEREGMVMCHLYDEPQGSAKGTVVRRGVDGGDAALVLANLECMIFTDRPDPEPAIERLEQAFRELER